MEDTDGRPLPACDREEVRERVAQDVGKLLHQLGEDLQAQLLGLHARVLTDLLSENKLLRTRLAAADDAMLHLLSKGLSAAEGPPSFGPVANSTAKPFSHVTTAEQAKVPDVVADGEEVPPPQSQDDCKAVCDDPPVDQEPQSNKVMLVLENCGDPAPPEPKLAREESPRTSNEPLLMSADTPQESKHVTLDLGPWHAVASCDDKHKEKEAQSESASGGSDEVEDVYIPDGAAIKSVPARSSLLWMKWEAQSEQPNAAHSALTALVTSGAFEAFISVVILCNCASMGLDAHSQVIDDFDPALRRILDVAEHVFTAVFFLEFLARCIVFGWRYYVPDTVEKRWNFMDGCLVFFTGILFTWLVPLLQLVFGFGAGNSTLQTLSVLRAARLARLVRVAQKIPIFREAWMLIRGLGDSMRTLFWTCIVICFVTYVFAIFGLVTMVQDLKDNLKILEETGQDEARRAELAVVMEMILGLDLLMYTLIQVLMGDSFHSITRPILYYISWSWLYFYAYIAVAVFVLMNLVTAIIVDNALNSSRMDEDIEVKQKEAGKAKDLQELKKLFTLMDADGSGTLSWSEFKDSFDDPEMSRKWMLLDFQPEECKELFTLLDDGDGEIETDEFFDGLGRMKGIAQSKDIFRLQKCVDLMHGRLGAVEDIVTTSSSGAAPRSPRGASKGGKATPRSSSSS